MRCILFAVLLPVLAGCQGVRGPFQRSQPPRVDPRLPNGERLSISEQESRGRDRLALPDTARSAGPETYMEPPGTGAYPR